MRFFLILFILLSSFLLTSCAQKTEPMKLTLVFSGNFMGELEPCGCTIEGDFGGIKRQATAIEQLRKQDPNLLLVSTGALLDTVAVTAKIKNEYILKGYQQINYDAIALQEHDLAFGSAFLKSISLPWLDTIKQKKVKGAEIIFATASHQPKTFDERSLTILITQQKPKNLQGIDILIIPQQHNAQFSEPALEGHTLIIRPGDQGQKLGILKLTVQQGQIKSYTQTVQALGKNIPDSPSLKTWYADYNQALKNFYQSRTKIAEQLNHQPAYVGAEACASCHVKETEVWHGSLHSQALQALKNVNKQFDPECVACHSVGYGKPGGFVDEFLTPQLANVQCESCHGSAVAHIKAPTINKMPDLKQQQPPVCVSCHNEKHSPVFNFKTYWPRIAH